MVRLLLAVLIALICVHSAAADLSKLTPSELRCEYLRDPLGVEEAAPRLSWILTSPRRAEVQTAYQVLVASTLDVLGRDQGDLWDSGRVETSDTNQIEYRGVPLASRQACFWKVRSWDRERTAGPWSEPATWEMGLLTSGDWTARWIEAKKVPLDVKVVSARYVSIDGKVSKDVTDAVTKLIADHGAEFTANNASLGGDPAKDIPKRLLLDLSVRGRPVRLEFAENAAVKLPDGQLPYLRTSFMLDKPVRSARLYATALGVYEFSLNGRKVGDQWLAPGWTDYPTRLRYQVYDVTAQLRAGKNALGAVVAPGWYSGHAGLFNAHDYYGSVPALLAQLEVTFADGTTERVISDAAWKTAPGPYLIADLQRGEMFDATAAIAHWDTPEFDDAAWSPATTRQETRRLQADICEPIRARAELASKALTEPTPGHWTFDLGQNMVGVVRLKLSAPKGTVVRLRHAEMLNPDGTIYTANLRGASSTDTYICDGGGEEVWHPRFTFHGFRYVELTGLSQKPVLDTITGIPFGSDMPVAGEFACSDPRLNQLQSNINWGLRGNYLSIPTDCPQRDERMGWMADAQVFLPTATFNADVAAFTTKWITDIMDAQRPDGAHADVAPVMKGLSYGTPAWGDAGSIVPWVIYETYGDKRILQRTIDSQIRWVEWSRTHSTNLIRDKDRGNDYGDWLSIKADTPKDLIGTAYFARSTSILTRSLRILGRNADAEKYDVLLASIKTAFNARYVDGEGRIAGNTQCGYILALEFDLLPEPKRDLALKHLEEDIKSKDWHLSTGFVGVSHLLPVLTEGGKHDTAYRLLLQDTFPSWLFSVKHGATTIWERWDGWTPQTGVHPDFGMNSFNHYSLGSCGRWLFEGVAGIARDPARPGFERIIIRPVPTEQLTSARASFRSIRGTISCAWKRDGASRIFDIAVPANTAALVYLPTSSMKGITESGSPLAPTNGIRLVRQETSSLVLELGSGTYSFVVPAKE